MTNPKFQPLNPTDFSKTLRSRVNSYFKDNNLSKNGNSGMFFKSGIMLTLFFGPLLVLCTGIVSSIPLIFGLYITSGIGMAGIGMGVMHDAIHGSYSKNKKVNNIMSYTMNLIGANATTWKIQHNVLHHTFTNIDASDDDINTPFFLRFSPHAEKHWIQKYQHLYVWFFYGISTLLWITAKDFVNAVRYNKMGHYKGAKKFWKEITDISIWKLVYYSYALVLPMIFLPVAWWIVLLAFISMHVITGLSVSIVFQTAHVMPDLDYPIPTNTGVIDNDWAIHQMATTTNFSPNSRFLSWCIGGLNYQVEHHLFPNICHVHYKEVSKIVAEVAAEYGVPYHVKKTFSRAIVDHLGMLRSLGHMDAPDVAVAA
ncbi:acyl-CoA desaturase [Cryomorpha ignava]|uniref:Acyl-CoA desaturase n=1 Tax=Cryomorpha ignava TaxID=101383 RepID=A0A7K3WQL0_9FLAO|nr:acyl-CoA desaturase [Cryomorpha ignava]NEN23950.1 acyl-CoA desaturase [Cryomorpha ignava]